MIKTIEPTGDVCVKFTEEELNQLNIKEGDKFNIKETDDGILLEKFASIELDISEWSREILEMLIKDSCDKDVSVNQIISDILENFCKNENLS